MLKLNPSSLIFQKYVLAPFLKKSVLRDIVKFQNIIFICTLFTPPTSVQPVAAWYDHCAIHFSSR